MFAARRRLAALAILVILAAAVGGYALGHDHRPAPLRRARPAALTVVIGSLASPPAIPPRCDPACPAAP
jgi:hypothetical protein